MAEPHSTRTPVPQDEAQTLDVDAVYRAWVSELYESDRNEGKPVTADRLLGLQIMALGATIESTQGLESSQREALTQICLRLGGRALIQGQAGFIGQDGLTRFERLH